jgi:hypothetical protein
MFRGMRLRSEGQGLAAGGKPGNSRQTVSVRSTCTKLHGAARSLAGYWAIRAKMTAKKARLKTARKGKMTSMASRSAWDR